MKDDQLHFVSIAGIEDDDDVMVHNIHASTTVMANPCSIALGNVCGGGWLRAVKMWWWWQ